MSKKAKENRQQINEIEKKLKPENQQYFDKLRNYLLTASFFYEEDEVTGQVLQLASDLEAAQENGETAVEFFGDDPKGMANQLIKGFKRESKLKQFTYSFAITLITWLSLLLVSFGQESKLTLNLVFYAAIGLFMFIFIRVFFYLLHASIYDSSSRLFNRIKKSKILSFLAFWVVWMLSIAVLVAAYFWLPRLEITIPTPVDLLVVALICLLATGVILLKLDPIFRAFLVIIWLWPLAGFLRRLPQFANFFQSEKGETTSMFFLLGAMLLFALLLRFQIKKELKKDSHGNRL